MEYRNGFLSSKHRKKGTIRYIAVYDINKRPRLNELVNELRKLKKKIGLIWMRCQALEDEAIALASLYNFLPEKISLF